jgi:4-hydroxy-3-polyprenylbenzoate decarboxylase
MTPRRLVVGISGASGPIYGIRILQALQGSGIETHLVMSESARITLASESDITPPQVEALASEVHQVRNVGATVASGSFKTMGMVIAPCSSARCRKSPGAAPAACSHAPPTWC